jgi:hypothetical protein
MRPGAGVGGSFELTGELEPYGHADEHPEPGLFGEQGPHRADALVCALGVGSLPNRLVVSEVEPAAPGDRLGEHSLQRRRRSHHGVLCVLKSPRFGDRGDRGIQLRVVVGALRHSVSIIIRTWLLR